MPAAHNKEIIDSFLAHDMVWYHPFLLHQTTSYTFQALLQSNHVNVPPKRKLLFSVLNAKPSTKNAKTMAELATDRIGSHLVDSFWKIADLSTKETIAANLVSSESKLNSVQCGRLVWRNCGLDHFKRRRDQWIQRQRGSERAKELFKEFGSQPMAEEKENSKSRVYNLEDHDSNAKQDEIDDVFSGKKLNAVKEGCVEYVSDPTVKRKEDSSVKEVLAAIEATKKKKKRNANDESLESSTAKKNDRKKKKSKRQFV
jgi:nucleolar protein 9